MDKISMMLERLPELLISFGGKVLVALIIFIVGKWVARMISDVIKRILTKGKMDSTVAHFLGN